jgi:peroxiredoxin/GNAT superfamily N-acetyltransferase
LIPGARGCTPQSCAFRDHHRELETLRARVFGLSTQDTDYQREAAERLHLPFPLLSDTQLEFASAMRLPTFEVQSMRLLKRLTLIIRDGVVEHVFYPVFPPDRNAQDVIEWLMTYAETSLTIRRFDIFAPEAQALIDSLNAELSGRYPEPGANHFRLDADEVTHGRGAFLIALRAGTPVGCGAIRRLDERTGEIKRMYVRPEERGRRVGRALLDALEAEARALGITRLVLETGDRQPEAIALYERAGFSKVAPFGEYVVSPLSVCMAKNL